MRKAIIDTNIWISALLKSSLTKPILEAFHHSQFVPIMSDECLKELMETLNEPKLKKLIDSNEAKEFIDLISEKRIKIETNIKTNLCRDPDDNFLLDLLLETKAPLVSLDKDLLCLKSGKLDILSPKEFLTLLKK